MQWLRKRYRLLPGIARWSFGGSGIVFVLTVIYTPFLVRDQGSLDDVGELILGGSLMGAVFGFLIWWKWKAPLEFGEFEGDPFTDSPVHAHDGAQVNASRPIRILQSFWRWFRSLEGWERASVVSAVIAAIWFAVFRLPALVSGDDPANWDGFREPLISVAIVYYVGLLPWNLHHYAREIGTLDLGIPGGRIVGLFVVLILTFVTIWRSIRAALLAFATLPRWLFRRVVSPSDG